MSCAHMHPRKHMRCMFSQMVMTQTKCPTFSSSQRTEIAETVTAEVHNCKPVSYLQWGQEMLSYWSESGWQPFCSGATRKQTFLFAPSCRSAPPLCICERPCIIICRKSLTQHSRPHTLDRLFSPILVEVLKNKKRKRQWRRKNRANRRLRSSCRPRIESLEAEPLETFCFSIVSLCQSLSRARVTQQLHKLSGCRPPLSLSRCWLFHPSDKNIARHPWAEMDGWMHREAEMEGGVAKGLYTVQ